jgi:transcriptional regulator with XRE-family HTH domain
MTDRLNPDALKFYRKQKGWTQQKLAEATHPSPSRRQISRWEVGDQIDNIRQSNRERLCEALGVEWEQLTRPPKEKDTLKLYNRVPLKGGIDGSARTFLTIVQWQLGLTEDAILDLAPLAVLILAKQSLRARQTALDETLQALEAATAEACRRLPYMPGAFHDGYDYDWIEDERKSLKDRELLMTHQDDEGNEYSPFVYFLEDQLKTLGLFEDDPIDFSFSYRGATPDYAIPAPILGRIVGLEPDNEADQAILEKIQDGRIDLQDVVEKKNTAEPEDYRGWLEERNRVIAEELASRFKIPDGLLLFAESAGERASQLDTGSTSDEAPDVENTNTEQRT